MATGEHNLPVVPDTGQKSATAADSTALFHPRAWAPFIAIVLSVPVALFILQLSHVSMINFIMLIGAVTAIALAPQDARSAGLSQGAKHAGIIIFDICGAGALGFVIVQSGFAQAALLQLTLFIPIILVPFLLAALIETAQGSRVVTAVITAEVVKDRNNDKNDASLQVDHLGDVHGSRSGARPPIREAITKNVYISPGSGSLVGDKNTHSVAYH